MEKNKKLIVLLIQIILTFLALWILQSNIDIHNVVDIMQKADLIYLILAFIAFNFSKIESAIRLNIYFKDIGLNLSDKYNVMLYYLGMFYNLFLPGGIGGDGYKIYLLHKMYQIKPIILIKVLLLDRISGLLALLFFTSLFILFSSFRALSYTSIFSVILIISIYPLVNLLYKYKYKEFLKSFNITNQKALWVQFFQIICAYFIFISLDSDLYVIDILVVFLLSSIVAVLPITIGGIGARELAFVYLFGLIGIDSEIGVSISLLFFLITALSSLIGIIFYKQILKSNP